MWDEIDPGEAEARGVYAPVYALSDSAPGAIVIAPGDIRGTRLIPEKRGGACCGLDGADGPNLVCEACDLPVDQGRRLLALAGSAAQLGRRAPRPR